MWRIWALSLGEKASSDDKDADRVAFIRTVFTVINITTCILISTNILVGWYLL